MSTIAMDALVPPAELLCDGTCTREQFAEAGPAFVWNLLVPRAGLKPHHAALDIGFGNGKYARVLTKYLKDGGSYAGFDLNRPSVEWCQRAYAPFPHFRFDYADIRLPWNAGGVDAAAYAFPYDDSTFDVAFAVSLFTHLVPAAAANYLRETVRVLKPGGRLLMTCFLMRDGFSGTVAGKRFSRASDTHHVIDPVLPTHAVGYDVQAMQHMVCDAGLAVCELTFGTWANGVDCLGALQDSILAVKP